MIQPSALPNVMCPGCDNFNFRKQQDAGYWDCWHCPARIKIDRHGLLESYYLETMYNDKMYSAYFHLYPKEGQPAFSLQFCDLKDAKGPLTLLKFNFLPKINAKNFLDKLKTMLVFG
jgi:hypothetical protein